MKGVRQAYQIAGALLAVVVAAPPIAKLLEARMSTHMLVQIPALVLAGVLLATPVPRVMRIAGWNVAGVPGLFAVSLVLVFWMTPIALDQAVAGAGCDAAKVFSLLLAGGLASASWRVAPLVVQVFFGGNVLVMAIAAGLLFQSVEQRLCNAYLVDDQVNTGTALAWIGVAVAAAWALRLAIRLHRVPAGDA